MSFNRRQFLAYCTGIIAGGVFPLDYLSGKILKNVYAASNAAHAGKVYIVKNPEVFASGTTLKTEVVNSMLEHGICALTGKPAAREAWQSLFTPHERIGIKINTLGGRNICTSPELSYAVAQQLVDSGFHAFNITIWDRLSREMEMAGYTMAKGGNKIQCFGTDNAYERKIEFSGEVGSCFSSIIARKCDALISIPVLKDHDLSGVSLNMKNFYGAIHNPNKYHDYNCNPYIADLNAHPYIKDKLRLVIVDGLNGQYNGGPSFKPQWRWKYGGLIMGRDPIAADRIGADIIEAQRKKHGLPSLRDAGRPAVHIDTAAKYGLGIGHAPSIEKTML